MYSHSLCDQLNDLTVYYSNNLGKIIENVKVSSVQNRAVRTVANLALDDECRKEIHDTEGLVENVVKLLKDTDDPECQQTYLRALR